MKYGLFEGIPNATYHAMEGVSNTTLKDMDPPYNCWAKHLDPHRPPPEEKAGQLEGNLAHCTILEPHEFDKRYIVGPSVRRNTNAWKAFVAEHSPQRIAIQQDQYDKAWRQAEMAANIPEWRELQATGKAEVSAIAADPKTGITRRCRPDFVHDYGSDTVILVDVKTYATADPDEFARQAARKDYEMQDAWYRDTYALAAAVNVAAFVFLTVSDQYPYLSSLSRLSPKSVQHGRDEYRRRLDRYHECQQADHWPAYDGSFYDIELPGYKFHGA